MRKGARWLLLALALGCGGFPTARHRPWPELPHGSGQVMKDFNLVSLVTAGDPDSAPLFDFGDSLLKSQWASTARSTFGLGSEGRSTDLVGPPLGDGGYSDRQLFQYVHSLIDDAGIAPGHNIYVVYLPPGVDALSSDGCAYHEPFNNSGDSIAVVPRSCATGWVYGELEALTEFASHEVVEAASDPDESEFAFGPSCTSDFCAPWWTSVFAAAQPGLVETGDLCTGTVTRETDSNGASWSYQRFWSNDSRGSGDPCVPASGEPYFNVSVPQDWYQADAGETISIPFTGWSTAFRRNWLVHWYTANGSDAFLGAGAFASVSTELGQVPWDAGCGEAPTDLMWAINNDVSGQLIVHVPAAANPGNWAVITLHSFSPAPGACLAADGEDRYHFWLVGVFVNPNP